MSDGYLLSGDAVRRTAKVVRRVEGQSTDLAGEQTPSQFDEGREVWVRITGELDGGGHYTATMLRSPRHDIDPDAQASLGDFGTTYSPSSGRVYVTNAVEVGYDTHALTVNGPGRVCRGRVLRRQNDRTIWVGVESYGWGDCTTAGS